LQAPVAFNLGARLDVAVDKDLSSGNPDFSGDFYGFDDADALIEGAQFVRLVHVSKISSSMLQVYQLNPHHSWHSHE
ncbi:MAG TPA: hypothetical protein VGW58_11510, partial [Pyrinomonadaceae bacterium]|nr:hypothetical protein [Pyrinomonadaceae bacterium]